MDKDDKGLFVLLAYSPINDEEKVDANFHISFIESTVGVFKTHFSTVPFIVADNEPLNESIVDKLQKPLLSCHPYRLHLAVKNILSLPCSHFLTKVQKVMKKLTNLKKSAALRQKTKLRRVLGTETRWSSTYELLKRYFEIKTFSGYK